MVLKNSKQFLSLTDLYTHLNLATSMVFHIPKAKTSQFALITLRYNGANLWNKFYHALLYKEPNMTNTKLQKLVLLQPNKDCIYEV